MIIRRALYYAQFGAAIVLPLWIFISHGIIDEGLGWDVIAYLFVCPMLFVFMLLIAGIVTSRKSVRAAKAVSWYDAGVQIVLYAALIAAGFLAWPVLAIVVVIALIGAFWLAIWEAVTEARARFRGFVDEINLQAMGAQSQQRPTTQLAEDARVIVINPDNIEG